MQDAQNPVSQIRLWIRLVVSLEGLEKLSISRSSFIKVESMYYPKTARCFRGNCQERLIGSNLYVPSEYVIVLRLGLVRVTK